MELDYLLSLTEPLTYSLDHCLKLDLGQNLMELVLLCWINFYSITINNRISSHLMEKAYSIEFLHMSSLANSYPSLNFMMGDQSVLLKYYYFHTINLLENELMVLPAMK
jgi:hypothetical protein